MLGPWDVALSGLCEKLHAGLSEDTDWVEGSGRVGRGDGVRESHPGDEAAEAGELPTAARQWVALSILTLRNLM